MVPPSLQWVAEFVACFNRAADAAATWTIESPVNPLEKHVVIHLNEPLGEGNYKPFQTLAHGFAKANRCTLLRILHRDNKLTLVIAMRQRLGTAQRKNPLLGDKGGKGG